MNPTVSVVVATYKRDIALKNALDSLGKQTYKDFEIILVDDNANEEWNGNVNKIVEEFIAAYPKIHLTYIVNNPNQGSAKTRNIGIDASCGEYVTFLDDDDLYLPEKIEKQIKFMQKHDYDYSVTDLDLYNENDKLIDKRVRSFITETTKDALLKYHLKYHITGTDTMMFKKEYLIKIGKFAPIDVGDEFYLIQRAIDHEGKFGYLPGSDIKAYVHTGEGGLSSGEGKIKGENLLYEHKKKYFHMLSAKDRRYIRMRHYAVLGYAYFRTKKLFQTFKYMICSFFASPVSFTKLLLGLEK